MQHQQTAVYTLLNNLGQSRFPSVRAQQRSRHGRAGWVSSDAQHRAVRGLLQQTAGAALELPRVGNMGLAQMTFAWRFLALSTVHITPRFAQLAPGSLFIRCAFSSTPIVLNTLTCQRSREEPGLTIGSGLGRAGPQASCLMQRQPRSFYVVLRREKKKILISGKISAQNNNLAQFMT